jgi:hypothetical protein
VKADLDVNVWRPFSNEKKYPYIVELVVAGDKLDVEMSRRMMHFHSSRKRFRRGMDGHGALAQSVGNMPARRFPPSQTVEELDACFVVRDHNGQALAYVYFEDEPGRRSAQETQLTSIKLEKTHS